VVDLCRVWFRFSDWRASDVLPVVGPILPVAVRQHAAGTAGGVTRAGLPAYPRLCPARPPFGLWLDRHAKWVRRRLDQGAAVDAAQPRIVEPRTLPKESRGPLPSVVVGGLTAGAAAVLADPPLAAATTAAGLTLITRADLIEKRIPRRLVHATAVVVAAALALDAATSEEWVRLASAGLFAAGAAALFTLAWLVEAVGFGDVRLAFLVTMTAGWHGLDVVVALWWWASVAALVASIAARRRGAKHIALAPAIALGWVLAVLPAE
jgi:Type IV leader peptidase family